MSQYSPLFKPWLNAVGADAALAAVADWLDSAAVYALDGEGRVLFWSRSAERLLGFSSDRVLGQPGRRSSRARPARTWPNGASSTISPPPSRGPTAPLRVRRSARGFFDARGKFLGSIGVLWPEPRTAPNPVPRWRISTAS